MKRGDVVIIDFPYSDRTGSKVRPSLVVQSDTLNPIRDDSIRAIITSMSSGKPDTENSDLSRRRIKRPRQPPETLRWRRK
ncbi:MAG: type II toxin-antitoxin system PemK/MazF family toxin [Isosphaeraceae bacterium]